MAYDTENMKSQVLGVIEKHDLCFIEDIIVHVPFSKQTFYTHELDKLDDIKEALENNRINAKQKMRKKWMESENATLQIGAYKLLGTEEERQKLSQQYNDLTSGGKRISGFADLVKEANGQDDGESDSGDTGEDTD